MKIDRTEVDTPLLALVASVALEADQVRRRLHDMRSVEVGRKPAWLGRLAGRPVLLLQGGMGKVNAAQALTAALETHPVRGVVAFGVAGAFPADGVAVGDLMLATATIYGDEGVEAPEGWLSTEAMGIPLLGRSDGDVYNEIVLPSDPVERASIALMEAGLEHHRGPFLTVSTCSGTAAHGRSLQSRFAGIAETMESAACAHVARLYEVPYVEVRGVSNLVEDRDLSRWDLSTAAGAAGRAVEQIVATWG